MRRPLEMERLPNAETGFAGDRHWYQYDGAGSVVGLTDRDGTLVQPYLYDEFGQLLIGNPSLWEFAYLGLGYDSETRLYRLSGKGYYDPVQGVYWLSTQQKEHTPITNPVNLLIGLLPILSMVATLSKTDKRKKRLWMLLAGMGLVTIVLVTSCTQTMMPTTGAEPPYEPMKWNDGPKNGDCKGHSSGIQCSNNCYSYAVNDRREHHNSKGELCKPQPGLASGATFSTPSCNAVSNAAVADGLRKWDCDKACPANTYKVALVVAPGIDYHWYRQDQSGYWSHKPGTTPVSNVDNSGEDIVDPRDAKRGIYTQFCGCFCVPKNGIRVCCYIPRAKGGTRC
jgi:YD repeat-containing protein